MCPIHSRRVWPSKRRSSWTCRFEGPTCIMRAPPIDPSAIINFALSLSNHQMHDSMETNVLFAALYMDILRDLPLKLSHPHDYGSKYTRSDSRELFAVICMTNFGGAPQHRRSVITYRGLTKFSPRENLFAGANILWPWRARMSPASPFPNHTPRLRLN